MHAFEARTGQRILERYGMTETGMNTSNPLHGERRAGTVGLPLPGVEVRVADEAGRVLAAGEVGVLEVRGPNVFKGYWRMPEKTARGVPRRRLLHHRRHRRDRRGRLRLDRRPRQGPDHLGRPQRLSQGDRERDRRAAGRGRECGDRRAASRFRRGGRRGGRARARRRAHRDRRSSPPPAPSSRASRCPRRSSFVDALPRNSMGKVQKNVLRTDYGDTFR